MSAPASIPTVFQILTLALGSPVMFDTDVARTLEIDVDTVRNVLGHYRSERRPRRDGTMVADSIDGSWKWELERTSLEAFITSIPDRELRLHPGALLVESK